MNLIIDIGNTNTKIALFNGNKMLKHRSYSSKKVMSYLEDIIRHNKPKYALISEVGNKLTGIEDLFKKYKVQHYNLSTKLKLPFEIDYKTPETLGADRIALVAGAIANQPNTNKLIIDAGTCITYDFVDENNVYHGGAISPGIDLRFKSLNDYTAKLPLLKLPKEKIPLTGYDTKTSIEAGVIWGLVNEIEWFSVKYNLKYKDLTIFLTGGSQKLLDSYIKNMIFVVSKFILLEGMNSILNLNK